MRREFGLRDESVTKIGIRTTTRTKIQGQARGCGNGMMIWINMDGNGAKIDLGSGT